MIFFIVEIFIANISNKSLKNLLMLSKLDCLLSKDKAGKISLQDRNKLDKKSIL